MTKSFSSDFEKFNDNSLIYPYVSSLRTVNFPKFHEKFTLIRDITHNDTDNTVASPKTSMFPKKSITSMTKLESSRTPSLGSINARTAKKIKNNSVPAVDTPQADLVVVSIINLISEIKHSNLIGYSYFLFKFL